MRHCVLVSVLSACCAAHAAWGQGAPTFSIDFQGPVIGSPEAFSPLLISEGDILTTTPLPAPGIPLPPGMAGSARFNPFGIPDLGLPGFPPPAPGIPSGVEVDALSFGIDQVLRNAPTGPHELLLFSVDEFATGFPTGSPPEVAGQGAAGAGEASADVYMYFAPISLSLAVPAPPFAIPPGNTQLFDGDGLAAPFGPILPGLPFAPAPHGVGLKEPNPPTPGGVPDPGDNLDALDADNQKLGTPLLFPVYYSLDGSFIDPIEGPPANTGSAAAIGFSGGDVLMTAAPGGPPVLYAPAAMLGLDLGGFDTDDLDALILVENGIPGYQVSGTPGPPFDWGPGMPADMLLFSVRRGSALIGAPDSAFGLPIAEGDILAPPLPGGGSPFPAIFIAAENLGLTTVFAIRGGPAPGPFGSDELDALDLTPDCDANGVPDNLDISYGTVDDCNGNGQPDICEIAAGAADCNVDGILDVCQTDTDGDGAIDDCDADDDNDGVPDGSDPDPLDPFACGDADADTCDDCVIGSDGFGPLADNDTGNDGLDTDGDGQCDSGDGDDDNDGVPDGPDFDPTDPNTCLDADLDGCDDCAIGVDGFGPLSDDDPNNDGVDTDSDGLCDVGDNDADNDGVMNAIDPDPLDPGHCGDADADSCDDCAIGVDFFGPLPDNDTGNDGVDTDGDGLCDAGDADDDNDGVNDGGDSNPLDPDLCSDVDSDGCDDCAVGSDDFGPLPDVDSGDDGLDTDGDGLCDAGDPDDDDDGVDDGDDPAPLDPNVCGDNDSDGCDDCDPGCTGGSCTNVGDCADLDADGVRDDNCIWWECVAGTCQGTNIVFADMGGQFGTCPVDGTADGNDRFHALNCFANANADGSTPYDCEDSAPAAYNVDAGGPFGSCPPDGVCDGNDAFHALNAFGGTSTCSCPAGPAPIVPPTVTDTVSLTLVSSASRLRPGGIVEVDVYFDQPLDDLRGYQLHVQTQGGTAGALRLLDIAIAERADAVFGDVESFSAFNVVTGQMFAGLEDDGVATPTAGYLATFVFQASKHAAGSFIVELLHDEALSEHRTFLTPTPPGAKIAVKSANTLTIEVIGRRTGRTGKR